MNSDTARRGAVIRRRREAHGIRSLRAFESATGMARATLAKIEAGTGTAEAIDRAERFLDQLDEETGQDTSDLGPGEVVGEESATLDVGEVEVVVDGPSVHQRWKVTYRAHEETMPQVTDQVARLLRALEHPEG